MYKYLEHQADTVIYAVNKSWPEVFVDGAKAVFNLMYNIKTKNPACQSMALAGRQKFPPKADRPVAEKIKNIKITVTAGSREGLFVEWLNELLTQGDLNNLILFKFNIGSIGERKGKFKLIGRASGISRRSYRGEYKTEVKAATYGALKCGKNKGKFFCQCILDL